MVYEVSHLKFDSALVRVPVIRFAVRFTRRQGKVCGNIVSMLITIFTEYNNKSIKLVLKIWFQVLHGYIFTGKFKVTGFPSVAIVSCIDNPRQNHQCLGMVLQHTLLIPVQNPQDTMSDLPESFR